MRTFGQHIQEARVIKSKHGNRLLLNPTLEEITAYMKNQRNYPQMRWVLHHVDRNKIYFGDSYSVVHSEIMATVLPGTGIYLHHDALSYGFSLGAVTLVNSEGFASEKGDRLVWSVYPIGREERAEHGVPQTHFKDMLMKSPWAKLYNIKSREVGAWSG